MKTFVRLKERMQVLETRAALTGLSHPEDVVRCIVPTKVMLLMFMIQRRAEETARQRTKLRRKERGS